MKNLFLIAIIVLGFSAVSFGQGQSSATLNTATSSAKIITPITLSLVDNMVFGAIASSTTGGTVVLSSTDNSRTADGVTLGINTGVQSAQFKVDGEGTSTYIITLPGDGDVKLHSGTTGAIDMELTDFSSSIGFGGTLVGGTQNFKVGATLNVNADQVAADYTATFPVTVNYN